MKDLHQMGEMCVFHNAETHVWAPGRRVNPGGNVARGRLVFFQTISGQALFRRRRGRRTIESPIGPGMAFLTFSDDSRNWRAGDTENWKFSYVNINLKNQEPMAREFAERSGDVFRVEAESPLGLLIAEYVSIAHNQRRKLSIYEASEMGYRFLMCLFSQFSHPQHAPDEESIPILVRQIEQYMRGSLDMRLNMEDLCKRAGVSAPTLNGLFRDTRGVTVMQRLQELRVDHARILLRSTNYPIKHIATQCGFSSQQYFCNVFHIREGVSPGAYRHRQRL